MRRIAAAAVATLTIALPAHGAAAATLPVTVEFQAFAPNLLDALPGDTVMWTNNSGRTHTVTADQGQFASGNLFDGTQFSQTFGVTGTYAYHCTIHPGMVGEVDVRRVTLDPLPPAAVLARSTVEFTGRTADPATSVRIERDAGSGFQALATASPRADGTWRATVLATHTARFRAAAGAEVSETRQLLVIDRTVHVHATRRGISVEVVPASPYARVGLQLRLRERFGWWPVAWQRLDYLSEATFRIHRRGSVLARVALLAADGWTPLAMSPVIRVGRG